MRCHSLRFVCSSFFQIDRILVIINDLLNISSVHRCKNLVNNRFCNPEEFLNSIFAHLTQSQVLILQNLSRPSVGTKRAYINEHGIDNLQLNWFLWWQLHTSCLVLSSLVNHKFRIQINWFRLPIWVPRENWVLRNWRQRESRKS